MAEGCSGGREEKEGGRRVGRSMDHSRGVGGRERGTRRVIGGRPRWGWGEGSVSGGADRPCSYHRPLPTEDTFPFRD